MQSLRVRAGLAPSLLLLSLRSLAVLDLSVDQAGQLLTDLCLPQPPKCEDCTLWGLRSVLRQASGLQAALICSM